MGIEMSVTEFKAKCLELFGKLHRHELDSVTITKRGEAVGVVYPPMEKPKLTFEEAMARYYKALESKTVRAIQLDPELDLTKPIFDEYEEFNAFHGRLLSQDD
jgi:hypothetical protein